MLDLTLVIPTFNRKEELKQLLLSVMDTNYHEIDSIIISDNHSNYDVSQMIQESFPANFCNKISVKRNIANTGQAFNLSSGFLYAQTKWLWIMGDDDFVTKDSVEIIKRDIKENPDCAWFKYSVENVGFYEKDKRINTLKEFIDYNICRPDNTGGLYYVGNNVINLEMCKEYLCKAFEYSYDYIGYLNPPLMTLDAGGNYMMYRSVSIAEYGGAPAWNYIKIFLGIPAIGDMPFVSLDVKYRKKFDRMILPPGNLENVLRYCYKSGFRDTYLLKRLYQRAFRQAPLRSKILYRFILLEYSCNIPLYSLVYKTAKRIKGKK